MKAGSNRLSLFMRSVVCSLLVLLCAFSSNAAEEALRVFIRGGKKTHGPGQHDHPRFLGDWTKLLGERGVKVDGSMEFPTAAQLEKTDVVVIYAADGMKIVGDEQARFEKFLQRGGGLVVIHDGVVSGDQHEWAKKVQGGAWVWNDPKNPNLKTKWLEGEVGIYVIEQNHPITRGLSNFDWKDEIYYDLDMADDAHVLATSFHTVFVIAPQLWTYEKTWENGTKPYRAFVSLPGHEYDSFEKPHYRAVLLRGIAWAGKRSNVDEFCTKEELGSMKYPEGGPSSPEKALAKLTPHPEFTVNLVASEPQVEKPMSMDWDSKGRLWVAETPEYPSGRTVNPNDRPVAEWRVGGFPVEGNKVQRPARDRISWLEDTNGDGVMDKKQVFYEGLELVTSMVFYRDGVIVAQAPDILWLRDQDGDGKAEKVVKLYTGFGTGDTHAVINNFRWGIDGWVYSAIGYSAGNPTSEDGSKKFGRITAGVFRFRPDGSALEQVTSGSCNTWGFDFAPDNEAFYTTATCGEHLLHIALPEKVVAKAGLQGVRSSVVIPDHQKAFPPIQHKRQAYVQIDWVGGFTASAGSTIYHGGAWPDKYNYTHFLSEPTINLVHHDVLTPKGASFAAKRQSGREEAEFLTSSDLWFRPIHTRVGPDGALYVIDFYNQAAVHNDTRGPKHGAHNAATRPDRDHHFARIYRVQHKQAKKLPEWSFASVEQTVKALEHPNGWVVQTAQRRLSENAAATAEVEKVARNGSTPTARINALWVLHNTKKLRPELVAAAVDDSSVIVRKNALQIISETESPASSLVEKVLSHLNDQDARAQIQALIALSAFEPTDDMAQALMRVYPNLKERHSQAAALAATSRNPLMFLAGAVKGNAEHDEFVRALARQIALKQEGDDAGRALVLAASASSPQLSAAVLESIAATLRQDISPAWNSELEAAFKKLLGGNAEVAGAALPLVARWDKDNRLAEAIRPMVANLLGSVQDTNLGEARRAQIAVNLLGVRKVDSAIVTEIAKLLQPGGSLVIQRRVIEALGNVSDERSGQVLLSAYQQLEGEGREAAFGQILRRPEWSLALLKQVENKEIPLRQLGPTSIHRLRTHADAQVAKRADQVVQAIRGPEEKQKDALVERFMAAVEKGRPVIANGKKAFTENCAVCHKFNGEGSDLAPDLTGMGVHGAHELLLHIVDPNRVVEPNFLAVSIETKDDLSYDGIVVRENPATVTLRNANGTYDIQRSEIKTRKATGLSLMPDGFEALGEDNLRDLIAYISADANKYRVVDMRSVFTADSRRGLFTENNRNDTPNFRKYGLIKAGDVPFEVMNPERTPTGKNLLVLKGGETAFAKSYPQKVEINNVGLPAKRIHFLGGIGGWAFPLSNEQKEMPVVKVTVHYAGGKTEEVVLRNGVEYVDWINPALEVPGSKQVPDLARRGQIRSFSKPLTGAGKIEKLTIESYNNSVAPVVAAITLELPENATASAH